MSLYHTPGLAYEKFKDQKKCSVSPEQLRNGGIRCISGGCPLSGPQVDSVDNGTTLPVFAVHAVNLPISQRTLKQRSHWPCRSLALKALDI